MTDFRITRRDSLGLATAAGLTALGSAAHGRSATSELDPKEESKHKAGKRPSKIIALEEHFATPQMMTAWSKMPYDEQEPSIQLIQGTKFETYLNYLGEERFAVMDAMGIDTQVLSLNTPGAQSFAPGIGTGIARESNDMVAELVRKHPDRYQGFGTLATRDPKAAAMELDRCAGSLGLNGILLNGRTLNQNIDDPDFLPIFEAASARNFPIYLHPQSAIAPVRQAYYNGIDPAIDPIFNISGLGWHYETGVQALRLILSGTLDRFPNLQIILGHWGEVVLFYLERIDLMSPIAERANLLKRPISDYFKTNFHVTPAGIYSQRYFRWSREVVGIDRIMFSSDYPYHIDSDLGAVKFLTGADISDSDREAVAHGNWDKLCANIKR